MTLSPGELPSGTGLGPTGAARPLVSIITVVLNRAATLERAIRSVQAQSYAPIEHVVIDGGSSDGTLEIIRRHADRLAHWTSGPDAGIADAFNKGLRAARGELIGLLNADDWLSPDQVARGAGALEHSGADFVFGDLVYHDAAGRGVHRIRGDAGYAGTLAHGMPDINHPTLLARRRVYEEIGGFDPAWRFAMDYDWLLRAHRAGVRGVYAPDLVGHMSLAGASDREWRRALDEVRRISIRHGYPGGLALARYACRLGKGAVRRVVARTVPAHLHDRLRRRINRRFAQET